MNLVGIHNHPFEKNRIVEAWKLFKWKMSFLYFCPIIRAKILHQPFCNKICKFLGPEHWRDKYKSCAGKYQSPIDIEESLVTKVSLAPLNTTGFDTPPLRFNITNNGHTGLCLSWGLFSNFLFCDDYWIFEFFYYSYDHIRVPTEPYFVRRAFDESRI